MNVYALHPISRKIFLLQPLAMYTHYYYKHTHTHIYSKMYKKKYQKRIMVMASQRWFKYMQCTIHKYVCVGGCILFSLQKKKRNTIHNIISLKDSGRQ